MKNTDLLIMAYGSIIIAMLTADETWQLVLAILGTFNAATYAYRILKEL